MTVKFNGGRSLVFDLIGGTPQGTGCGQIIYTVASNDVASDIEEYDKYTSDAYINTSTNERASMPKRVEKISSTSPGTYLSSSATTNPVLTFGDTSAMSGGTIINDYADPAPWPFRIRDLWISNNGR